MGAWNCPGPYVLPSEPSSGGDPPGRSWCSDLQQPRCPPHPPPLPRPGRPSERGKVLVDWVLSYLDNLIQLKSNFWESSRKWDRSSIIPLTSPHISPDEVGDGNECFPISACLVMSENVSSEHFGLIFIKIAVMANCDTNWVRTNNL